MSRPQSFSMVAIGDGNYLINENRRTVAIVTAQGYIDWLLRTPDSRGPLLTDIAKQTHLSYVLGLKLLLTTPTPSTHLKELSWELADDGSSIALLGEGETADGRFASRMKATLALDAALGEYTWECRTVVECTAAEPVALKTFEYNNVYPGKAGRCFLFAPDKQYHSTLMEAADGTVWEFPHQHLMHYGRKIADLAFPEQGMAGFFGEQSGSPAVITHACSWPVTWGICDMYYDLHCMAVPPPEMQPGECFAASYTVRYLSPAESRRYTERAIRVPVTAEDFVRYEYPRLELGMNHFDAPVAIDGFDDASGFRQRSPDRVWEKQTGKAGRGALRLTNATATENVWSAEPPTQIPASTALRIAALARTRDVKGKGFFLRVRYHTFVWHPTPHVEWTETLESVPLTDTHDEWTRIEVPRLEVPAEHIDYLVWIDVILDGEGTAWLTDVDVDLVRVRVQAPSAVF